jgi:hypothetical protein
MRPVAELPTLLPLFAHPQEDPTAWRAAAAAAEGLTVVVRDPDGDPVVAAAMAELSGAGAVTLGYVTLSFATRRAAELLDEVRGWAGRPADGVFLDQVPTSPFSIGPVAIAARAARRAGLRVVLNPGAATDRVYRELRMPMCSFEGPWWEYQRWRGIGSSPGDGHLVHSVPRDSHAAAWALLRERQAGFGLVTDRTAPNPYGGAPAWLIDATARRRDLGVTT